MSANDTARITALKELAAWAITVAQEAPERFSKYGNSVYIPRSTVSGIRATCDRLGIEWRRPKHGVAR